MTQKKLIAQETAIKDNLELVESLNNKIKEAKKKQTSSIEALEKFKSTSEYEEIQKNKDKIKENEEKIDKTFSSLRTVVDFKALGNFFHFNEGKMKLVKNYKENFKLSFRKNAGRDLLDLIKEANLNASEVENKIEEIKSKMTSLDETIATNKKDKTKDYENQLDKLDAELDHLYAEAKKQTNRLEKLKNQKKEFRENLIKEVEGFGVKVK